MPLFLKSRTFWTVVVVFVYNGLTSLVPVLPNVPWVSDAVNALGLIMATYFHINPSRTYNPPPAV